MIWKTAWKNVWRNKVRSLVVIASVTVGIFAGVFMVAFMNGMIVQRMDAAINEEISHIQMTGKNYRLNNDSRIILAPSDSLCNIINNIPGVEGTVGRIIASGMAATAAKSAGVEIIGVDPSAEKKIFTLDKTIMPGTGDYFEKESKFDLALVGQDLAKELNIIRYSVDSSVISRLREQKVDEETLAKLSSLEGTRFPTEKKFTSRVSELLSANEVRKYGWIIRKAAWSFRPASKLTLTFLDNNNNQVNAVFRVAAIYDLKNTMVEQTTVFVKKDVLERLAGIEGNTSHQIIIRIKDIEETQKITDQLRAAFPGNDINNWKELQPDLAMMTDYVHQIYGLFMGIILAALAFGIINTMLMAVLERTRELGMLTAIGMNKKRVFSMIMLESVFLSIIGGVTGMIVGYFVVHLTAKTGINFEQYAEGMEAFGYSAHVFPVISSGFFVLVTIMVIVTGVASAIYPALKALRLDPAEAIRTE
ncbi:MAG: FtsX-like permease family protein [Bacteroidales bacterium]